MLPSATGSPEPHCSRAARGCGRDRALCALGYIGHLEAGRACDHSRCSMSVSLGELLSAQASILSVPSCRHLGEAKNAYDNRHALHTFSVGIAGSPDLLAARKVKIAMLYLP